MSPSTESPIADAEDRRRAAELLDRNVVVEAGAGTGKTTLLIERLAGLILGLGLPVEKVVALTFTEKAAGEIKVRLAQRLEEIVSSLRRGLPPKRTYGLSTEELLKRAESALERLDRAPISTIHGFASRLLKLYPLEAGLDPAVEIDEGPELEDIFEEEWALWLEGELAEDTPQAERWLPLLKHIGLDALGAFARELGEAKLDPDRLGPSPDAASRYRELAREAEALAAAHPGRGGGTNRLLDALSAAGASFRGLADHLDGRKAPPAPEIGEFSKLAGWSDEDYARAQALARIAKTSNATNEKLIEDALELLDPFARRLRDGYARRGWISFDGLLVKARDLVKNDKRVREALKSEFAAYLIDEFQDTDPLQGELLLFLAERPGFFAGDWRSVKLAPGKLFVVGDPKQSIYRFRGADIAAFEAFVGLMRAQGAEFCRLTSNFRSRPAILNVVNTVMARVMVEREGSQPEYAAVSAARPETGGPAVELLRVEDGASASESRDAEGQAVAGWIADYTAGGGRLKDVAILLRSMNPLGAYLEALKARELAYVVEGEKSFFQSQEVLDFFNLLHAIDEPANALALAGVLRSPLGGLTDADLLELKRKHALDYRRPAPRLPGDPAGLAKRLFERLRELHEKSGRLPVGDLLEEIFQDPMLLGPAALAYHREQTVANLLKFRRLASHESDRGLTLKEFTRRLERSIDEWRDEGESPLADASFDAVRLLTIHKAKGLEFPVVLLPNLGARTRGASQPAARHDWARGAPGLRLGAAGNAAMGPLDETERAKESDEALRLLYVALTRAKTRLVLVGAEPSAGSLGAWLRDGGVWPPEPGLGIEVRDVAKAALAPGRRPIAAVPGLDGLEPEAYAALCREREKRVDAAPPLFIRPSLAGERDKTARDLIEDRPFAPASAALLGTLCHRVLERWDFARGGDVEAAARRAAETLSLEEPAADWDAIVDEAREMLSSFLASGPGRELAEAEIVGREVPFLYPSPSDKRVVHGVIDLLYRKGGRLYVADYKTDEVGPKEARERAEEYRAQGALYVEAVKRTMGPASFRLLFLRPAVAVDLVI